MTPRLFADQLDELADLFHPPYLRYRELIGALVERDDIVLEIGAGSGMHTRALAASAAKVVALDVSMESLRLCAAIAPKRIAAVCGDMAMLPFPDASFDVVASAGSLSYGDPLTVNREVFRVLRPGGTLLIVDSLNHNPVYRLNRWRHYRRGDRTRSTLLRMPTMGRIRAVCAPFGTSSVEYFGTYTFVHPALQRLAGDRRADRATAWLEEHLAVNRLAFKFVLVATDFRPERVINGPGNRRDRADVE